MRAVVHEHELSSTGARELVFEAMRRDFELQRANRGEDWCLITDFGLAQHLNHALLIELG